MGIQGLLPLLKSIMNPIHIKELAGCSVAVDTYSWLHKGALSCSTDLCKGQPTSKHIDYCMHRVNMLRHYGVKPILVFDGGPLPMKGDQEIKRARSRKENLSRALEHEANGNRTAAYECFQKAVDISPSVAYDLIQVLKKESVSYVVAPYEADSQMTFLALGKHVDAVITEDSDLIAFGCPRIIYKMDKYGQGVEFKNDMLQYNKELNLAGFTQMMLLEMCILSGCDYLQSLPGMGLKKAHALMKKFKTHENVIKHLKYSHIEVPPLYEESFKRAILTFKHQRVYDAISEQLVHLSDPEDIIGEDLDFLGPSLPHHVAKGIARGDLDPFTKEPIQGECDATEKVLNGTYQLKNFKPDSERKKLDLPVQKNLLTNYFCFASLEAKRKFRAPRITPILPNGSNETSSLCVDVREVKNGLETGDLKFREAQDHVGTQDERGTEMNPFIVRQSPVCKPCISLLKESDSHQDTGNHDLGNKNVIVRSPYFLKKSRDENRMENVSDPYKKDENKNVETVDCEAGKFKAGYSAQVIKRKQKVRSSYFREVYANENIELPELEGPETREGISSLESTVKKRKIAQTCTPNDNKWSTGNSCSEEEEKGEEEKLASNISHLGRYSDIAQKSMEKFVSVVSSFRFNNSSGSRASGLRAPLKDINNKICMKSLKRDVDLSKFSYEPTKQTRALGFRKK